MPRESYRCLYCDSTHDGADAWLEHLGSVEHRKNFFAPRLQCDGNNYAEHLDELAKAVVRSAHEADE